MSFSNLHIIIGFWQIRRLENEGRKVNVTNFAIWNMHVQLLLTILYWPLKLDLKQELFKSFIMTSKTETSLFKLDLFGA